MSRTYFHCCFAIALQVALAFGGSVRAQPRPRVQAPINRQQRELAAISFEAGVAAFEAERFEQALTEFQRAYEAAPHPAVLVNIANCHDALGHAAEAVTYYERYLREADAVPAAERREIEAAIARLRQGPVHAIVELTTDPQDAVVHIDGQAPTIVDGHYDLVPGPHDIDITAPQHRSERRHIEMTPGQVLTLRVELAREATLANPLATESSTPTSQSPAPSRFRTWTWLGLGLTGALAIATVTTGVLALDANAKFEDAVRVANDPMATTTQRANAVSEGTGNAQTARDLALVTDILLGVSVAAAGATVLFFVLDRGETTTSATSANLRLGIGVGQVQLHLSF